MSVRISSPVDIAVSGLRAQSLRMNVISSNIANANVTRNEAGENKPYRPRDVVMTSAGEGLEGVTVGSVVLDVQSAFKRVHLPGHPDADSDGWVMMPNVEVPREMMNLIYASRAYEANAAILKRYQEIMDVSLELLK